MTNNREWAERSAACIANWFDYARKEDRRAVIDLLMDEFAEHEKQVREEERSSAAAIATGAGLDGHPELCDWIATKIRNG